MVNHFFSRHRQRNPPPPSCDFGPPPASYDYGRPQPPPRTVKIYTKAEPSFSLSIRNGDVILAPDDPLDDYQVRRRPIISNASIELINLLNKIFIYLYLLNSIESN